MPHRVALVGEANGVRWYDDSKATNPDATRRAVSSFDSVVLLAGGRNKGLDLSVLAAEAARLRGVVAFGEAGPEIAAAFARTADAGRDASPTCATRCGAARRLAQPGRRRVAVARVRVVRRVLRLRGARRRLRRRGARASDGGGDVAMTAVSPRMPLERLRGVGNPFARRRPIASSRASSGASSCRGRRRTSCCARPSPCSTSSGS